MSRTASHDPLSLRHADANVMHELRTRLLDAGILLMSCDKHGEIKLRLHGEDGWLAELFCGSPVFRRLLRTAVSEARVKRHSSGSDSYSCECMPGLWLVLMPLIPSGIGRRRGETGYSAAIIVGEKFVGPHSEDMHAICHRHSRPSTGHVGAIDVEFTRSMLQGIAVHSDAEVARLISFVQFMHEQALLRVHDASAAIRTSGQLAESYEEISLLYSITERMIEPINVQQPERFVRTICEELRATLPYGWVAVKFASGVGGDVTMSSLADRLIVAGRPRVDHGTFGLLVTEMLADVLERNDDLSAIVLEPGRNPAHEHFAALGRGTLIHPMGSDGDVLGIIITGERCSLQDEANGRDDREMLDDSLPSSVDMKLIAATAVNMEIFLRNAALYDELNAMFLGTLEALTASIDAKDRYTCGHSQRVAHLTAELSRAAGMDEQTVRRMHIAGIVHDVGKIGVPERVLLKPGKLTDDEFEWIRQHPEIGHRILKSVPQITDILPGVLHHHERWDGHGYPNGLRGEEIPLVARFIALADSFDAMSSTRTYRSAMERRQVLAEIRRCAGRQFDPELVPLFLELDFSEYDRQVCDHRDGNFATLDRRDGQVRGVAA